MAWKRAGFDSRWVHNNMEFTIKNANETLANMARRIGYIPTRQEDGEHSLVRKIEGEDYPRFHIYIEEDKDHNEFVFNLHLDQKLPSYTGTNAHSGEYKGEVIETEAERIKRVLSNGTEEDNSGLVYKF